MGKLLGAILAVAALAAPSSALAVDRYVDVDTGSDDSNCATLADPCASIFYAQTTQSSPNDTIRVDSGTYPENQIQLEDGRSLVADNFNGGDSGRPLLQPASGASPVIFNSATAAGTISGFRIDNEFGYGISLNKAATITDNVFESKTDVFEDLIVAQGSIVTENVFDDEPEFPGGYFQSTSTAILVNAAATISDNEFMHMRRGINVTGGIPDITGNEFTDTFGDGGVAVEVTEAAPTIADNYIHFTSDGGQGVVVDDSPGGFPTGATLARNTIAFQGVGVHVQEAPGVVSLNSDLFYENFDVSVNADEASTVEMNNVTSVASGAMVAHVRMDDTDLTMNSSLLEHGNLDEVLAVDQEGDSTCAITFSFHPTGLSDTEGACDDFAYTGSSGLSTDLGSYALPGSSQLVDAGDPAAPVAPNDLDSDGDLRALDGKCPAGAATRDVGADEFVASPAITESLCNPPVTPPPDPPVTTPKKKKKAASKKKKKKGKKKKK